MSRTIIKFPAPPPRVRLQSQIVPKQEEKPFVEWREAFNFAAVLEPDALPRRGLSDFEFLNTALVNLLLSQLGVSRTIFLNKNGLQRVCNNQ